MPELNKESYKDIEYFKIENFDNLYGRSLVLMPYKNREKEWKIPFEKNGKILLVDGIPHSSVYLAKEIDNTDTDLFMYFLDFIYKKCSYHYIIALSDLLIRDIQKLFTQNAKIDTFYVCQNDKYCVSDFVQSEIEYMFITAKSIYDSLQNMISKFWLRNVKIIKKGIEKKNLPPTYRRMIYIGEKYISQDEIENRYGLPKTLSEFYIRSVGLFEKIKNVRDDIIHHGKGIDYIFRHEDGFAVTKDSSIYKNFEILHDESTNKIASIRPLLKYLIDEMLNLCNSFAISIQQVIKFPPDMIDEYKVFIRVPQLKYYHAMSQSLERTYWWK